MAAQSWWKRFFPPVERLAEPGSTPATVAGVFLAYAAPVVLVTSFVPLLGGDTLVGLGVVLLAAACWTVGHRLVSK